MSEEGRRGADEGAEKGPGQAYQVFVVMEDLVDKLKLLQYEDGFIKGWGFKPLPRHYFAIPTNPGEQFYAFTSLCAWLITKGGKHFDQPQEYDDPNATISNILDEVRRLGGAVDFPPSKLKQGCGEHAVYVLDKLADEAMTSTGFAWEKPVYPEEEMEEETMVDDDAELTLNKVEDEMMLDDDEIEEEETFLDLEGLKKQSMKNESEGSKPVEIMESTTDAAEWKLEVERVLPSLKVHIKADNKDWRAHFEQMLQHRDGIEHSLTETRGHLDKLHQEITRTLEKIGSREKYINNQLESFLQEFRAMQDQLAQAKEKYREGSGGVTERTRELALITEELEQVKSEMEERGTSMTDGTPLVKIKQALTRLKTEMTQMDIRMGVVEHTLNQAKLKDKSNMQRDMNKPVSDEQY